MAKKRTWNIIDWPNKPEHTAEVELECPNCETQAWVPVNQDLHSKIIATKYLLIITSPSCWHSDKQDKPVTIQCRKCRHSFTTSQEN